MDSAASEDTALQEVAAEVETGTTSGGETTAARHHGQGWDLDGTVALTGDRAQDLLADFVATVVPRRRHQSTELRLEILHPSSTIRCPLLPLLHKEISLPSMDSFRLRFRRLLLYRQSRNSLPIRLRRRTILVLGRLHRRQCHPTVASISKGAQYLNFPPFPLTCHIRTCPWVTPFLPRLRRPVTIPTSSNGNRRTPNSIRDGTKTRVGIRATAKAEAINWRGVFP